MVRQLVVRLHLGSEFRAPSPVDDSRPIPDHFSPARNHPRAPPADPGKSTRLSPSGDAHGRPAAVPVIRAEADPETAGGNAATRLAGRLDRLGQVLDGV